MMLIRSISHVVEQVFKNWTLTSNVLHYIYIYMRMIVSMYLYSLRIDCKIVCTGLEKKRNKTEKLPKFKSLLIDGILGEAVDRATHDSLGSQ